MSLWKNAINRSKTGTPRLEETFNLYMFCEALCRLINYKITRRWRILTGYEMEDVNWMIVDGKVYFFIYNNSIIINETDIKSKKQLLMIIISKLESEEHPNIKTLIKFLKNNIDQISTTLFI